MNEILIYGPIGKTDDGSGVTAEDVKRQLAQADRSKVLTVRIDSEGGDVFKGFSIYDAFDKYDGPKRCVVESAAFSIASFIPMAFDDIEITGNGYFMLHDPAATITDGRAEQFKQGAELLAKIRENMIEGYALRTKKSREEIIAVMEKESFFNAEESLAFGLVSRIDKRYRASIIGQTANLPISVYASLHRSSSQPKRPERMSAATLKEIKAAFPKMGNDFFVKALESEMTMDQVSAAANEEMSTVIAQLRAENETLKATCKAFEEKLAGMTPVTVPNPELEEGQVLVPTATGSVTPTASAGATPTASAKVTTMASGVKPVANVSGVGGGTQTPTATARWRAAVNAYVSQGKSKSEASRLANRENPGLREQYVAEFSTSSR